MEDFCEKYITFAPLEKAGGLLESGLRVLRALGNANNGGNAGSCYLNGNNGVGASNANYPALLNNSTKGEPWSHDRTYRKITLSLVAPWRATYTSEEIADFFLLSTRPRPKSRFYPALNPAIDTVKHVRSNPVRRIRDKGENESVANARNAYEKYSNGKHKRWDVAAFDADIENNLLLISKEIVDETFTPLPYRRKVIHEKKRRVLAKTEVHDHALEAAAIYPYEQKVYDYISWRSPAVRPGMGTHGFFRCLRNTLYACSQEELAYNFTADVHRYFPLMNHEILKEQVDRKIKPGKLRRFLYKVIDSYLQGIPLGIKVAQLLGMIMLAKFDRDIGRLFGIGDDPEKMSYWTSRYIDTKIATAKTQEDFLMLSKGSQYLARTFEDYVNEGVVHYFRFVDNIIVLHRDKAFLHIVAELMLCVLARDYRMQVNKDWGIRPTWMGIRVCGYVFYHERVLASKNNKKRLARRIHRLKKSGRTEEEIRKQTSSQLGFVKHANVINFIKHVGMENTLGKIIKRKRTKIPFQGMKPEQKVRFSSICANEHDANAPMILLLEYTITDSKIDKTEVSVTVEDSAGNPQDIKKMVPSKTLAIRFKRIQRIYMDGGIEKYIFTKKRDRDGVTTLEDEEYYAFTGSKVLIDQALNDFSEEDLPCPTIIRQFTSKSGKTFLKFT